MLKWKVHECYDYEADFLDALRQCEADNFALLLEEERFQELARLKEDLHRLDADTEAISALRPDYRQHYQAQKLQAEYEIELKIEALQIPNVRLEH